jgi:hypothetical protein
MRVPKLPLHSVLLCSVLTFALGCNALLDNDPRSLEEDGAGGSAGIDSGGAGDDTSGGSGGVTAGSAGGVTGGSAGESGSATGGSAGESGNGSAGEAGSEGDSSTAGSAGSAGAAGDSAVEAGFSDASRDANADNSSGDAHADVAADAARDADAALEAEAAPPDPCKSATRACTAGEKGSEQMACDSCGTGKATRTRTCEANCSWGAWSAYGACVSTEQCTKGATETHSVACPCGGSHTQSRTCSNSCTWGGWTDTGSKCSVGCCGKLIYCDTPDDLSGIPASRGTWCQQTSSACSHAQVDEDCRNILDDVSCTLKQVYYIDYL